MNPYLKQGPEGVLLCLDLPFPGKAVDAGQSEHKETENT